MDRDTAVARINDGLGFRETGHPLTDKVVLRLIEAQRDLQNGKTLPRFLLQEDQTLTIPAGEHSVVLPERFLRIDDDNLPHFFFPGGTVAPVYLRQMFYSDAVRWVSMTTGGSMQRRGPRVFAIRKSTIDFIAPADKQYDLIWNYYKGAMTLETNTTNFWLNDETGAPEWLIGEAGYRMAYDARDKDAMTLFDDMRTRARSACLGDQIAEETAGGPLRMGANL